MGTKWSLRPRFSFALPRVPDIDCSGEIRENGKTSRDTKYIYNSGVAAMSLSSTAQLAHLLQYLQSRPRIQPPPPPVSPWVRIYPVKTENPPQPPMTSVVSSSSRAATTIPNLQSHPLLSSAYTYEDLPNFFTRLTVFFLDSTIRIKRKSVKTCDAESTTDPDCQDLNSMERPWIRKLPVSTRKSRKLPRWRIWTEFSDSWKVNQTKKTQLVTNF